MMQTSKEEIGKRAERMVKSLSDKNVRPTQPALEIIDGESVIGGGSAPSAALPTKLLAIACNGRSADELAARLRCSSPPVIARVDEGRVLLDLRTVFPEQDEVLTQILAASVTV